MDLRIMLRLALLSLLILGGAARSFAQALPPEAPPTAAELAAIKAAEEARINAIAGVYGAVVAIYGNDRGGGGSGVLYDPSGLALTNHHVVAGAGTEGWAGLADGKLYRWRLIGTDPGGDVAIIQLLGKPEFPIAPLGDSNTVRVGDFAMAMGNPFILAEDQRPTVTLGMVSGIERYQPGAGQNMLVYGNCIQVDSSINPGNSGGPLFNLDGEVIGINGRGSFKERGRVNVGLGYAISINQVKNFLPDLLATKMAQHGTLDAVFGKRGGEVICHTLNLDSQIGKLGLQLGDKLLAFEGQPITSANQFTNLITTLPAGWPCEVTFEHEGKSHTIHVRLTPLPYGPQPQAQPMPEKEEPEKKDEDDKKDDESEKKPESPAPGGTPVRRAPPNFGAAGEVRDEALNRENAKRLLAQWKQFTGEPASDKLAGWQLRDTIKRGDEGVGEQTITIASDGRFLVEVTLDDKLSRFGYDGSEFWSAIGDAAPEVFDCERLIRNPFAAQGYILGTLGTAEPLATIGKVLIDAGDKANKQLAYRLKAIDADTDEFFVWLSVLGDAGQPQVRLLKTAETYDDERTAGVVYDQWREVGGVKWPHERRVVTGLAENVTLTITTSQVQPLETLDNSLFKKPDHGAKSE
jgi:serine protease Do